MPTLNAAHTLGGALLTASRPPWVELTIANLTLLFTVAVTSGVLIWLLHQFERRTGLFVSRRLGWRAVLVTGWLGVPLHELAHLVTARLFGHRIVDWKLFDPDPASGTLGYVRHAHKERTLWQLGGHLFIGIAPLLAGAGALAALLHWMLPDAAYADLLRRLAAAGGVQTPSLSWATTRAVIADAASLDLHVITSIWNARSAWLPLQLYLAICIASHLAPSPSDMHHAWIGLGAALLVSVCVATLAALVGMSVAPLIAVVPTLLSLLLLVGCFQLIFVAAVALISR